MKSEGLDMAHCEEIAAPELLEHDTSTLARIAAGIRDRRHATAMTYSPKVFIPLTQLCRDVCGYCTFAKAPSKVGAAYLSPDEVLAIAKEGAAAGCKEALFTLGDKPELRYAHARKHLAALGHETTVSYVVAMARLVIEETGLSPHINAGILNRSEMAELRTVSFSQGLMLESLSERLCERGGPHYGSPDKHPKIRMEMIDTAGELAIPFTTGILIGIGETRRERVDALLAIRDSHRRHAHIQEVIIQNFRAKPYTRMARAPEPSAEEMIWTVAAARIVLGADMSIQAPPNLSPQALGDLIDSGINDWGGISPVTIDHVNPEAPWPQVSDLARQTAERGRTLVPRLTVYPHYALHAEKWIDKKLHGRLLDQMDSEGLARADAWSPGLKVKPPILPSGVRASAPSSIDPILDRASRGEDLDEQDIVALFAARDHQFHDVCAAADRLRREVNADTVTYVVTRNINYTNVCYYRCRFCAFSKGKRSEATAGKPYVLDLEEIVRRSTEAWARGATEVCLQGGIHPDYTGETYLEICRAIKAALPSIHIHAFSPLEVWQGAATLGISVPEFLDRLHDAGLGSLPGTAAEILDDEIRRIICPDKVTTEQWLFVIESAHRLGLKTTATIMFGHVDRPEHWARHLLRLRTLQKRTEGFTEFVPLPFVPMEAPMFLRGQARRGPTYREAILMHAVSRLVLHPWIPNIQASWPKMGREGAAACLTAGCNDLGGTLMNESISRAAGAGHGEEFPPHAIEGLIRENGRAPSQRTTLYNDVPSERFVRSFQAEPLLPIRSDYPKRERGVRSQVERSS